MKSDLQFSTKKKKKKGRVEGQLTGKREDMHCCYIILFPLLLSGQPFLPIPSLLLATEEKSPELGDSKVRADSQILYDCLSPISETVHEIRADVLAKHSICVGMCIFLLQTF